MAYTHDKSNYVAKHPYKVFSDNPLSSTNPSIPEVADKIKPLSKEDISFETTEIEKGEVVFQPTGEMYKALGKIHSQGGTPVNLPEGSFIFSDYKPLAISKDDKELFKFQEGGKYKVKNNTPAKLLAKEVDIKHHNTMIAVSSSDKHDDISKKSAQLMIQKNFSKVGKIAFLQEEKKGFPQGLPSFSSPPQTDPNIERQETMSQQFMQLGGKKKGYGNVYGPKYSNYIQENPDRFDVPTNFIPYNITGTQHQAGDIYGSPTPNGFMDEFKQRHSWYFDRNPGKFDPANFQKAYNTEAQSRGYDPYFVGKAGQTPRAIDGKFGEYTRRAPGFKDPLKDVDPTTVSPERPNLDYGPVPTINRGPSMATPDAPEEVLGYDPRVPFTPLQKFSMGQSAYNAASINKYAPKRMQISFTPVNLEKVNAQPYLNQINSQTQQAYKNNQVMNPIIARAQNSQIYGQSLDKASQTLGQIDNQNLQISNQENMYNNQGINRTAAQNVQLDNTYYNQVQAMNQNYDDESRFARNRLFDEYKGYRTANQDLELKLQSQPTFGTREIYQDPQTGQISTTPKQGWVKKKQSAPLYDYDNQRNRVYYTGAGMSMDQVPSGSTAGMSFEQLRKYSDDLGLDPRGRAYIFRDWAKQSNVKR